MKRNSASPSMMSIYALKSLNLGIVIYGHPMQNSITMSLFQGVQMMTKKSVRAQLRKLTI